MKRETIRRTEVTERINEEENTLRDSSTPLFLFEIKKKRERAKRTKGKTGNQGAASYKFQDREQKRKN